MRGWVLIGCVACTQVPEVRPPPGGLTLAVGPFTEGRPVTFTTTGARPGAWVHVLASAELDPSAPRACPTALGSCLDLGAPTRLVGLSRADATGTAVLTATVPVGEGVRRGAIQAVVLADRSPVVEVDVARVDPFTSLVFARDRGSDTGMHTVDLALTPALEVDDVASTGSVRSLTDGPDGWVYAHGFGGDLSRLDPVTGLVESLPLPGAPGARVDITNLPGDPRLFLLREVNGDRLEAYDPATGVDDQRLMVLGGVFSSPRAITDGPDGRLWAIDAPGLLMALDPNARALETFDLRGGPGTFEDLTGIDGSPVLWMLRDLGGDAVLDTYEPATGTHTPDVVFLPGLVVTGGQRNVLTDTNDGRLVVAGEPDAVLVDPGTGAVTAFPVAMRGTVLGVTNVGP